MHNKTEAAFEVEMPRHETDLEIEVVLTAGRQGAGRSTILHDIETILHSAGFVTRGTHELLPGLRAKLEGRKNRDSSWPATRKKECPLCGRENGR